MLEELHGDEELRRELAEELLPEVLRSKELRRIILVALYREIATKEDIESLRNEIKRIEEKLEQFATKEDLRRVEERLNGEIRRVEEKLSTEIKRVEGRLSMLEQRVAHLEGMLSLFIKLFIAFNIPILIGIIGILLKMVFS